MLDNILQLEIIPSYFNLGFTFQPYFAAMFPLSFFYDPDFDFAHDIRITILLYYFAIILSAISLSILLACMLYAWRWAANRFWINENKVRR